MTSGLRRVTSRSSSRELLRGEVRLQLTPRRSLARTLGLALLLLIPMLLLVVSYRLQLEQQAAVHALQRENQQLGERLARQALELQLGTATERQLTQRNAALLAQIERLSAELAFFRRQNQKP